MLAGCQELWDSKALPSHHHPLSSRLLPFIYGLVSIEWTLQMTHSMHLSVSPKSQCE